MRRRQISQKESNLQERRFFSRKEFTLPASNQYGVQFFDENGRFPNVPGNIGSANKIVNGQFALEGIGFGVYLRDTAANQNQALSLVPSASVPIYNSILSNSAIRVTEGNKTVYEVSLVDMIRPIVNVATGGTPLQDTNLTHPDNFFGKLRLNVPYLLRQEQTFSFELTGLNLSTNTGAFLLYAEMLGRFQFNSGYGAA